jgi:BirA family transcriptional regulator, biotin operon repressor / biotin---[acetyl-CoA-carboxylase] ligase
MQRMDPAVFKVLRALADGALHSIDALAAQSALTREAVGQALATLEQNGLTLIKARGGARRLPAAIEWLDRDAVLRGLGDKRHLLELEIYEELESTNTLLTQRAALGLHRPVCVAAEWQTRGRGRRGRPWVSGPGGSLTFSVLWPFPQPSSQLSGLSLASGVAIVRALRELGIPDVKLKWPNDVVHGDRKLAGILVEVQGAPGGSAVAVIGAGLNLRLDPYVREAIDQAATDLEAISGRNNDRNRVFALLLSHFIDMLRRFEAVGFTAFSAEWMRYNIHQGRMVSLLLPDGTRHAGEVQGIAADGSLRLRTGTGERRYTLGEISLRRNHDLGD